MQQICVVAGTIKGYYHLPYLIWYNTERPHRGIGKIPPLRYYLDNFLPTAKSNMYWTLTPSCHP